MIGNMKVVKTLFLIFYFKNRCNNITGRWVERHITGLQTVPRISLYNIRTYRRLGVKRSSRGQV